MRRAAALAAGALLTAGILAGCGGGDDGSAPDPAAQAAPPAAVAKVSQPTPPGEAVRPGPGTPPAFTKALRTRKPILVSFVMPGVADDDAVRQAVRAVRADKGVAKGVAFFVFSQNDSKRFGDLPELLGVQGTPSVAVIGRDRRLTNLFRGVVDQGLVRQAVVDAKSAEPATGNIAVGTEAPTP